MTDQIVVDFQKTVRGRLIQPSDADYDTARALYNGMIDKRPRLIARCADVADVITAVNFARDQGLLLAIRGGGHNGPLTELLAASASMSSATAASRARMPNVDA